MGNLLRMHTGGDCSNEHGWKMYMISFGVSSFQLPVNVFNVRVIVDNI